MVVESTLRPVTSVRLLCETAEEAGIAPEACLKNTGLTFHDLNTSTAQISTEQEVQSIENYVRLSQSNVGLGVAVAKRMHVNVFGIWGFAILTSPTLRSAIETAIEYVELSFVIADMTLREASGRAKLEFDMRGLPPSTHRFILERHSCVGMTFIREMIQEPHVRGFSIETIDEEPAYARALSMLLEVEVVGGASENALTFPVELLDRPLPKADPNSLRYCLDQCQILMDNMSVAGPSWSQKVRDVVIDNIGSDQRIEDIAEKLSVTERTLRRRLADEGTSFRELYTDLRLTLAGELLSTTGLNVETVAWRVGYAEPASFVRAFSKKFGKTPGEIRKE